MATPFDEVIRSPRPLTQLARTLSILILVLAVAFMMGEGLPSARSLSTEPGQFTCFALMLLGLVIAWRRPLEGALVTLSSFIVFGMIELGVTGHLGRTAALVFPIAAGLHFAAWWRERGSATVH